mmetsp:Transcript_25283/g.62268  ORF Transcript_25283/g.62268 Transcript_25283/m.62268 type:complete len:148 (-) Transcript_25283:28-471(-)
MSFFPKCASYQAYQDCFEECPFSTNANQKKTLNLAVMVATFCWAWSENSCPSIRRRKARSNNDGDTVACDDSSVESFEDPRTDEPALGIITIDPELGSPDETDECPSSFKEEEQGSNSTEEPVVDSTPSDLHQKSTTQSDESKTCNE